MKTQRSTFNVQLSTIIAGVVLLAGVARGQTVSTVTASNITSWSATLHGSYTDLSTNAGFGYELKFYYGKTDGGTNVGDWDGSSGGTWVQPTSTNNNYGSFSRSIVELEQTNTYYYRAFATDLFTSLWATQSLSFVTKWNAPTSTPSVAYRHVVVGTNGVLHSPVDFFEKNGILPTQGVDQIFIRITSNELNVAYIFSDYLSKSNAAGTYFSTTGGPISGEVVILTNMIIEGMTLRLNGINHEIIGKVGGTGQSVRIRGGGSTLVGTGVGGDLYLGGAQAYAGGVGGQIILESGVNGSGQVISNLNLIESSANRVTLSNVHGRTVLEMISDLGQNAGLSIPTGIINRIRSAVSGVAKHFQLTTPDIDDVGSSGSIILETGANASGSGYSGGITLGVGSAANMGPISLVRGNQALIIWTNITLYGPLNADIRQSTNLPLSGLRLANSYTGGVMTLQTTDGVTFFLK